ncbi:MAG: hypothetical protein AUJ07_05040 [Crenarchaeota archaeon 13_1_40CM_3_53_5]|nr:MAG: hypothetical protein AUJ07_05040 [Crenarchaeota archaeon 13_1_40CM_3_53_5]
MMIVEFSADAYRTGRGRYLGERVRPILKRGEVQTLVRPRDERLAEGSHEDCPDGDASSRKKGTNSTVA